MNSYRVYTIDTSAADAPITSVFYFQAEKYGPAWQNARKIVDNSAPAGRHFFSDKEMKNKHVGKFNDNTTVAKITDMTERNKKLDKSSLADILANDKLSDADKLKQLAVFTNK